MGQPILDEHRRRNRETRSRWDEYTAHRNIVTNILLDSASAHHESLCLLGAGNCNDLDLNRLAGCYEAVHLVDVDEEALSYAIQQTSGAADGQVASESPASETNGPPSIRTTAISRSSRLVVHSALDVSGVAHDLETWQGSVTAKEYGCAITTARQCTPYIKGESFDVVASCCLLSQLIDSVVLTKTESNPHFHELLFAVRDRHLQLLWHWTKPGGVAVLVSDFVATTTFPQLAEMDSVQLAAAFPQLIEHRNFFTGTNPVAIRDAFSKLGAVETVEIVGPWTWPVGARVFAVCAVIARKP